MRSLSEFEAKKLISSYGIPTVAEEFVRTKDEAKEAAKKIGYPVVLKGCGKDITHKTDLGLVELNIQNEDILDEAFEKIASKGKGQIEGLLVQKMIKGAREFVVGMIRDKQFGPCVMFGLGGIFTEVIKDVSFRVAPLEKEDALEMMDEIKGKVLLGEFRGEPPVDKEILSNILINCGRIGIEQENIEEIDINPLIIDSSGKPIAVDALVVMKNEG